MARVQAIRITVYCPVSSATLAAMGAGDSDAVRRDPQLRPLLEFLEGCPEFGRLGPYAGVSETLLGIESFTPLQSANPSLGRAGERSHSPTAVLVTYAQGALTPERLEEALQQLAALHPWETPVIVVARVELLRPAP